MTDYDAILLVSFGGPEGPDDVIPFMEQVTAGRNIPRERLEEVSQHYHRFGGRSPINDQCRALRAALQAELAANGMDLPVYWGNRNWHPLLPDTLREMRDDGIRRALAFVTSAYSSRSGCRQYREDLEAARSEVGAHAPEIDKIRVYYNHPGFVEPQVELVRAALEELPDAVRDEARIVFTTHSIPLTMSRHCDYEAQTYEVCRLIGESIGDHPWDLVYNSRSGPPSAPWLEPDVNEHLAALAEDGVPAVVVVPVGFVSDHMEVVYDLDAEAAATAAEHGLAYVRAATVGVHPRFVAGIRELIEERLHLHDAPRRSLGTRGPNHDVCPLDCCLTPGQERRPAVADAAPAARP